MTKNTFKIAANAKIRNRPWIVSTGRVEVIVVKTTALTIMNCCANLMKDNSGEKAHRTLMPAKPRYSRTQRTCGDQETLRRREKFRTARINATVAIAGQKNLFSMRVSISPRIWLGVKVVKSINGDRIVA